MGEKILSILNKRRSTYHLFTMPSALHAIASFFDFFGHYYTYNAVDSSHENDAQALNNDWKMIGQDLHDAMRECDIELEEEKSGVANKGKNQQLDLTFNE